jgi:cytoplasmic iron level regulating protein YaaA (DUF328/UPF0246 family)
LKKQLLYNLTSKEKSPKYLSELMEISAKLADENWQRNQVWKPKPTAKESCPALFAFTGEVYRGIDAKTLDKNAIDYLQKNHRILSGLYGLLKPSDKVMLYRLEMGRNFEFENYKNLYEFWTDKVTEQLNSELKKNEIILNLASNEYGKVINRKKSTILSSILILPNATRWKTKNHCCLHQTRKRFGCKILRRNSSQNIK